MKFRFTKKTALGYLSFFLCTGIAIVMFMIMRSLLPSAVSYSASNENTHIARSANAISQKSNDACLYSNISDIAYDGPFSIRAYGEEIYVFANRQKLYRIKANLSDFPQSDKQAIISGIEAENKPSLFEIVSYMES